MNIWIIQAQENPAEDRSINGRRQWRSNTLAEVLADKGHEVVRWRSAFSHQAKHFLAKRNSSVTYDNYTQNFIACSSYKNHIGFKRIRSHQALGKNFLEFARKSPKPDLIHVGNVPIELAHAAVKYAKEVSCPVVIDVRDLWPDIYVDFIPDSLSAIRPIVLKALKQFSFKLKWTMKNATAFTGLTQPYMDWALELAGRTQSEQDAIFGMSYPRKVCVNDDHAETTFRGKFGISKNDVLVTYVGNVGFQSDFDLVIEAAQRLSRANPNLKFVIAGSGPALDRIRNAASGSSNVILPGWLNGLDLSCLLHISQIGLIAFKPVPNYLKNIPNKYPEYLSSGMAVACGLGGEMGRLTIESGCGFVYKSGDVDDFCAQLGFVLKNNKELRNMQESARALHADKFDSASIYPAFASYLETVAVAPATGVIKNANN